MLYLLIFLIMDTYQQINETTQLVVLIKFDDKEVEAFFNR